VQPHTTHPRCASRQPSAGHFLKAPGDPMTADECRMLQLLEAAEDGCTDALLMAHGFALEVIFNVVKAGLATAEAERLHAASQPANRDSADDGRGKASVGGAACVRRQDRNPHAARSRAEYGRAAPVDARIQLRGPCPLGAPHFNPRRRSGPLFWTATEDRRRASPDGGAGPPPYPSTRGLNGCLHFRRAVMARAT
jgi:hypothetical protein